MDAREEIKKRLSVEEVIADYVQLRKSGRNFKALSPFTHEKVPSFMVSPAKQIWHDFSSGQGGDIFSFVMLMEGTDFPGAMEILARRAGVDLSQYRHDGGGSAKFKQRLLEANELAVRYYQASLSKNKTALEYVFKTRGFDKATVTAFQIGYAPSTGDALVKFMLKRGYSPEELVRAGLAAISRGQPRDMFRSRIVLPLADNQGRIIGFTGRILGDGQPKYLNTPQTLLYDKSGHIYGLHLAKAAIRDKGYAVIVEGNLDVVASHMAGVTQTVGIAGTAMTSRHLLQLSRLSEDLRLAFDEDEAGINATKKALILAQSLDVSLSVITLTSGKDPDEIIRQGKASWQRMIDRARYAPDWLIERLAIQHDTVSVRGKKRFSDEAVTLLAKMSDAVEREHYAQEVAKRLDVSAASIIEKITHVSDQAPSKRTARVTFEPSPRDEHGYQDLLLGLQLRYPEVRDSVSFLTPDQYAYEWRQETARYLTEAPRKPLMDTPRKLRSIDTYVKIALFKTEELYQSWSPSDLNIEAIGLARRVLEDHQQQQKDSLITALQEAEGKGDEAERTALITRLQQLIKGENDGQDAK